MTVFFDRQVNVIVRTTPDSTRKYFRNYTKEYVIENLRVTFTITKTLKSDPNLAEIEIYNLSRDQRELFATLPAHVTLLAGYKDNMFELYRGDVTRGSNMKKGPDYVTKISCGTGANAAKFSKSSFSTRRGGTNGSIIKKLASDAGLSIPKNVDEFKAFLSGESSSNGKVITGSSIGNMAKLAGHHGIDMSIQDDSIVFVRKNGTRVGTAALLSPSTGMVGNAELSTPDKPKEKPVLSVSSLLRGDFKLGGLLKVSGSDNDGTYKISTLTYKGDTHGNPWYSELEGVSI